MKVMGTDTEVVLLCWLEGLNGVAQVTGEQERLQRQQQRKERKMARHSLLAISTTVSVAGGSPVNCAPPLGCYHA